MYTNGWSSFAQQANFNLSLLMEARREEIDTSHTRFIDAANPLFYSLSVVLIFFTLLSLRYLVYSFLDCFISNPLSLSL